jgi:hypothetical protein
MSTSDFVTMQQKRGLKANLPASAPSGQLLIAQDTRELFVGTGTGVVQIGASGDHKTEHTFYDDYQQVYADGFPGTSDPKAREGWYFTNASAGNKINWYFYDPTVYTTTVASLKNAYAICTFDTNKLPFFSVYTAPTGAGDFAAWYKSSRVYNSNVSVTVGTKYLLHFGTDPGVYAELPRIVMPINNAFLNGAFASSEMIYLMAFHTDSGAGANTYKFVTHELGFQTATVNREFSLKVKSSTVRTFTQSTPSTTWTISHNLGTYPKITTVDNSGSLIEGNVTYICANTITVEFSPAVAGKAYITT